MTFHDAASSGTGGRPADWRRLPGTPDAYFLAAGEGEHAMLFDQAFTVLASGAESEGHFGVFTCTAPAGDAVPAHTHAGTHETFLVVDGVVEVHVEQRDGSRTSRLLHPGDFGFVPAGLAHAYRVVEACRMVGTATGGFERFFEQIGAPVAHGHPDQAPYVPTTERMRAAAAAHDTTFHPGLRWDQAADGSPAGA